MRTQAQTLVTGGHYVVRRQRTASGATVMHIVSGPYKSRKAARQRRGDGMTIGRYTAE